MIVLTPVAAPDSRLAIPQERITAAVLVKLEDGRTFTRVFVEGLVVRRSADERANYLDVEESPQLVARIIDAANERA